MTGCVLYYRNQMSLCVVTNETEICVGSLMFIRTHQGSIHIIVLPPPPTPSNDGFLDLYSRFTQILPSAWHSEKSEFIPLPVYNIFKIDELFSFDSSCLTASKIPYYLLLILEPLLQYCNQDSSSMLSIGSIVSHVWCGYYY